MSNHEPCSKTKKKIIILSDIVLRRQKKKRNAQQGKTSIIYEKKMKFYIRVVLGNCTLHNIIIEELLFL